MANRESLIQFRDQNIVPVLWADFNDPLDTGGGRCARADSWDLHHGDPVKLDADDGMSAVGVVYGEPWTGPSGTRYVRVVTQ